MGKLLAHQKGQASVEFMFALAITLALLSISTAIYVQNSEEAAKLRDNLEASRICMEVSTAMASAASAPGQSSAALSLPPKIYGQDYTVRLSDSLDTIKVDYATYGAGCRLPSMAVQNSSGAHFFEIAKNATIISSGGAVVVVP